MATVTYSLEAKVRSFVADIRKARWELVGLEDQGDKASAATDKLGKSSKTTTKLLQSFKEAAEGVGGKTGESAGKVEKFGKAISGVASATGVAGAATLGMVGGLAAFAAAATAASLKTSKWVDELKKAGKTVPVSKAELRKIETMEKSIKDLTVRMKQLGVTIGTQVAPAIEGFVRLMDQGVGAVNSMLEAVNNAPPALEWFRDLFLLVSGIGASPVWKALTGEKAFIEPPSSQGLAEADEQASLAAGRTEVPGSQSRGNRPPVVDEAKEATEALTAMAEAAADVFTSAEQRIQNAYGQRIEQIDELIAKGGEAVAAAEATAAVEAQRQQELIALGMDRLAQLRDFEEAQARLWDAERKRHEEAMAEAQELKRQRVDLAVDAADATIQSIMDVVDASTRGDGQMTESQKRAAKRAFRVNQVLAIAQTVMSTSAGMIRAFQDVPYPASIAAAAQIGVQGTAQTAIIAAQQPNFAMGGVMEAADHSPALLQPGEGVLTRAGVENVGGAAGIAAINQGRVGGGPVQAVVQFDHRWFDRGARQNIQRGGSISRAINERSGPVGQMEYGSGY